MMRSFRFAGLAASALLGPLACSGASVPVRGEAQTAPSTSRPEPEPPSKERVAHRADAAFDSWLAALDDASRRSDAVHDLIAALRDELAKAGPGERTPRAERLLEKALGPLTNTYADHYADLAPEPRTHLIHLLSDLKDPLAEPALRRALDEFAANPGDTTSWDAKWAIQAYGSLKLPALSTSVLAAYQRVEAHTKAGALLMRDFAEAMLNAPSVEWVPQLVKNLGSNMPDPARATTPFEAQALLNVQRDEWFRQEIAAEVIGRLRDVRGADALLKARLDPSKAPIAHALEHALVELGAAALDALQGVLDGSNRELIEFRRVALTAQHTPSQLTASDSALVIAANLVGLIGLARGTEQLLTVLRGHAPAAEKALVARNLPLLPATKESKSAFRRAFEATPTKTKTKEGALLLVLLAQNASLFYDAEMVPWLIARASQLRGAEPEEVELRGALAWSALDLVTPEQLDRVKPLATQAKLTDFLRATETVLARCERQIDCYLTATKTQAAIEDAQRLTAPKAAYMLGILGDSRARDRLVAELGNIHDESTYKVAIGAVDHLTEPEDARAVAERIAEQIAADRETPDLDRRLRASVFEPVRARLMSRGNGHASH